MKDSVKKAYESQGVSYHPDINSGDIIGFSEATFGNYDGQRQWAAKYPFGQNVTLWTGTHVSKIIVKDSVATGVEILKTGGVTEDVYAAKEVIVSSGAQGSPKLLLLR